MNPIDALFRDLRAGGRKAFMPFLTAGDPDLDFTEQALHAAAEAGASVIEVGFPFSDPIADGPVVQASYTRALGRHLHVRDIFERVAKVTSAPGWKTPLVAMVSYTLVHRIGPDAFIERAQASGFSGAIVPDLPAEEADELARKAAGRDFKLILLVTPTTPLARAEKIVRLCSGFLYCVSVVGITGERDRLPEELARQLRELRRITDLPLCVGFGVSRPDQAQQLREVADGVVVGSAIVRRLEKVRDDNRPAVLEEIRSMVREFVEALQP